MAAAAAAAVRRRRALACALAGLACSLQLAGSQEPGAAVAGAPAGRRGPPWGGKPCIEVPGKGPACRPSYLIIGADKCATSSLYYYMQAHPLITAAKQKQIRASRPALHAHTPGRCSHCHRMSWGARPCAQPAGAAQSSSTMRTTGGSSPTS